MRSILLESSSASDEAIKKIAEKVGLDHVKLVKDMNDPSITIAIERNLRLADSLSIEGTPAYLIGDRLIPGAIDLASLTNIVSVERARLAKLDPERSPVIKELH